DLREYVRVLWQGKWIVAATLLVAVGAALAVSFAAPKRYRTETELLIFPPLAQEVGGDILGTVYSPQTYKRLAMAADLLQQVIEEVYPPDERPSPAGLQGRMEVELEPGAAEDFPGRFPLHLRVRFTGTEPARLQALARTWADEFTARNAKLFLSRTAQSYEYIKQNFDQVEAELLAKEAERRDYAQQHPLELLQAEVDSLQAIYQQDLKQLGQLHTALAGQTAAVAALQAQLEEEPAHIVLESSISEEALWTFLAGRPDAADLSALPELVFAKQEVNPVYTDLRRRLTSALAESGALRSKIDGLEAAVVTTAAELKEESGRLAEVQSSLARLDREISVLEATYTSLAAKLQDARISRAETAEPIRVVEEAVLPPQPIGPSKKMNLAVATVLGLFAGVLLAFFWHWVRRPTTGGRPGETGPGPTGREAGTRPAGG
ncbi:MAG: GumC family protein, partial [Candidatus Bipolaricaulaceae bacterium]